MISLNRRSIVRIIANITLAVGFTSLIAADVHAQSAGFIEPSNTVPLVRGQKLKLSDYDRMMRPYTIQRLTERVYWVEVKGYQSTVLVGKSGVLVIDAPRDGRGAGIIQAIRAEITELPITTLVYSHYHYDHVGGANAYVEEAKRTGTKLRIVGTKAALAQIERYGGKIPVPTEILSVPRDKFKFEESTIIEVGTPPVGHSTDNSWILLRDDKVLHNVDLVHPGLLEFPGFGIAEDLLGYEESVRELLTVDWDFLVAGHSNIGSREDVQLVLDYFENVRDHVIEAIQGTEFGSFLSKDKIFYAWFVDYANAVSTKAVESLRPKWGEYPGFDVVAKSHAEKMLWHLYMH